MTKIYGASDDLIEFEGEVDGEVGAFGTDDDDRGVLLVCSDGTVLEIKYGKAALAIWGISVLSKGFCFDRIEPCDDEDAHPSSDIVYMKPGLKRVWSAREWALVK